MIDLPSRFWSTRDSPIKYIVLHTTQGTDSRTWLTQTGNVSSHYLVQGPVVYRLVDEDNAAWHAGIVVGVPTTPLYTGINPNDESIGIEIEGFAAEPMTAEVIATTAGLIKDIWRRRGALPLVSHAQLSPGNRSDPGLANFAALIEATKEQDLSDEYKTALQEQLTKFAYQPVTQLQLDLTAALARIAALEAARTRFIPHTHKTDGGVA